MRRRSECLRFEFCVQSPSSSSADGRFRYEELLHRECCAWIDEKTVHREERRSHQLHRTSPWLSPVPSCAARTAGEGLLGM